MIPLGDIDLRREIRLETGIVGHRRERPRVRRVYTAKIEGRLSDVTVAVYQGEGAEEVCYNLLSPYMFSPTFGGMARGHGTILAASVRESPYFCAENLLFSHPNFVQICRFASSSTIHAAVFNDGVLTMF
jgi:hypothetical protein